MGTKRRVDDDDDDDDDGTRPFPRRWRRKGVYWSARRTPGESGVVALHTPGRPRGFNGPAQVNDPFRIIIIIVVSQVRFVCRRLPPSYHHHRPHENLRQIQRVSKVAVVDAIRKEFVLNYVVSTGIVLHVPYTSTRWYDRILYTRLQRKKKCTNLATSTLKFIWNVWKLANCRARFLQRFKDEKDAKRTKM